MANFLLVFSLILLLFFNCKPKEILTKEKNTKDSIVYVDKIRIDTIKLFEKIEIEKPTENEINLKCDSTSFNQNYKSGKIEYKIIKEKGAVRVVIKTDTISKIIKDSYYSKLYKKDSISKIKEFHSKEKTIIKKENNFWQNILLNIWKILFWIFFTLWILGITFNDMITTIFNLNNK